METSNPQFEGSTVTAHPPLPASPLLSRYEVFEEIGRGGMGVVYRGRHCLLDKPVAVKLCAPGQDVERFRREARLLASIRSPHAVPVHDFDLLPDGRALLIMEWIPGSDLKKLLSSSGPRLSESRVLPWMKQVSFGMQTVADQGIVHRDLKPSNILIDLDDVAHVMDFGLARSAQLDQLTMAGGMMLGTPHYMAPEQAEDPRTVDTRADIYSFGATFYHALTGQPPFAGETSFAVLYKHKTEPLISPRSHQPDLTEVTTEIVERCLAKSPADRFASFREVNRILDLSFSAIESSPWHVSDDPELMPYLARYRHSRERYLSTSGSQFEELDVYQFPDERKLRIHWGNIVEQPVEVIVSSDTSYLMMEWGVSEAIGDAAGREVIKEARRQAPIRAGRAAVTSGGNLPARLVFHGITVGMTNNQLVKPSRDLISEIMSSCFYHAESHAVESIAFPLLGTGAMKFARDVCLDTMFVFLAKALLRGLTSVRDARIVLYG